MTTADDDLQSALRICRIGAGSVEEDEGEGAYASWDSDAARFSLTCVGSGHVTGCLIYKGVQKPGEAWRIPLTDPLLRDRISRCVSIVYQRT